MILQDTDRDPYGSSASIDPCLARIEASFDRFEKDLKEALEAFERRLTRNLIFISVAAVLIFSILSIPG